MHATVVLFSEVSNTHLEKVQWASFPVIKEKKMGSLDIRRISAAYTSSPDTNVKLYLSELQLNVYVKIEKWDWDLTFTDCIYMLWISNPTCSWLIQFEKFQCKSDSIFYYHFLIGTLTKWSDHYVNNKASQHILPLSLGFYL